MKIIAVSGWKGSGKDMIAEYLVNNFGFKRLAFADVLKDMVAETYAFPRSWCDDREFKEKAILSMPVEPKDEYARMIANYLVKEFRSADGQAPVKALIDNGVFYGIMGDGKTCSKVYWTPRALCILEGSTKRSVNSNFWVQRAVSQCQDGVNYVISDARYKNEIDQLRLNAAGSVTSIRIDRFDFTESTDSSERDLDTYEFDYRINNRKALGVTQEEVFQQLEGILYDLGLGLIEEQDDDFEEHA